MIWAIIALALVVGGHLVWDVRSHNVINARVTKVGRDTTEHFRLVDQFIASVVQRREQIRARILDYGPPPGYVPPSERVNDYWIVTNGRREVNPKYRGNS